MNYSPHDLVDSLIYENVRQVKQDKDGEAKEREKEGRWLVRITSVIFYLMYFLSRVSEWLLYIAFAFQ